MPVGSKYRFVIPGDIAYGADGSGQIGPNATLVFEVEMLEIAS
jgi:FKBP-type peptidyl-prolyl cis-trans isomerase